MENEHIFRLLEIEPTDDKKAIKKAYARMVRQYHPEEQPEKWKEIHDAYEAALAMAERSMQPVVMPEQSGGSGLPETETVSDGLDLAETSSDSGDELEPLFETMGELSARQKEAKREEQRQAAEQLMQDIQELLVDGLFDPVGWEEVFKPDNVELLLSNKEYMHRFGDCLAKYKIHVKTWQLLKEKLGELSEYYRSRAETEEDTVGIQGEIDYAERKMDAAHYASVGQKTREEAAHCKKKRFLRVIVGVAAGVIIMTFAMVAVLMVMFT